MTISLTLLLVRPVWSSRSQTVYKKTMSTGDAKAGHRKIRDRIKEESKRGVLSKREITRQLGTSATQLYRLLDPTNYRESVDRMLALLQVLDCDVDLVGRLAGLLSGG